MNLPLAVARYDVTCRAPWWARGGHAQTIAGHVLASRGAALVEGDGTTRVEIQLDDGDRLVALARAGTSDVGVVLMHGLSGDANADYMRRSAARLCERGHTIWAVNHRGCGAGSGLARHPYHSGRAEDLAAIVAACRAAQPALLWIVVGFSLSGNIALLHAGRRGAPVPDGIVAVNPPVDLARASRDVSRGLSRLYDLRFMWRLGREIRARYAAGLIERRCDVPRFATLCEFDDLFTAPEGGFASGADYYARCSSAPHLAHIEVPTAIVTAADDPFVDASVYDGLELSRSVLLHVEPHGGHVGYVSTDSAHGERWLDGALLHYVDELAQSARAAFGR